ncbi:hypothetical protein [Micromonospora sp. U21]|uniref:hypothetical protein n=1 Tax=Micromonospora sp. U21 TaxID=2824899 RepID=UPI001B366C61|nr:hypothetical protein [Micromonospora sp. U21]MBQ0906847.1 hypothetical protein [Micromonospora sp. U21]
MIKLQTLPAAPAGHCPPVRRAWRYLVATQDSVDGLLDSFNQVRTLALKAKVEARGRLSSDELDLLRAALVFTSSGLDACCHQLVRDALPALIARGGTAELKFREHLRNELYSPKPPDGLLEAIAAADPRRELIERYVMAKTKASFQGSGDLQERVRDTLGITNKALAKGRFTALDGFFIARNDIVHRLDYENPTSASVKRHHRNPNDVATECDTVLALVADLIHATAELLKRKAGGGQATTRRDSQG